VAEMEGRVGVLHRCKQAGMYNMPSDRRGSTKAEVVQTLKPSGRNQLLLPHFTPEIIHPVASEGPACDRGAAAEAEEQERTSPTDGCLQQFMQHLQHALLFAILYFGQLPTSAVASFLMKDLRIVGYPLLSLVASVTYLIIGIVLWFLILSMDMSWHAHQLLDLWQGSSLFTPSHCKCRASMLTSCFWNSQRNPVQSSF
jgi:hypothetical protein